MIAYIIHTPEVIMNILDIIAWGTNPLQTFITIMTGEVGDAVIMCGSSVGQVRGNVDACRDETPLPKVNHEINPPH